MPDATFCPVAATRNLSASLTMQSPLTLADLPLGASAHVVGVRAAVSGEGRELALRLLEIGFVEGEPVRVIALGYSGREPIAVRVGGTTFALRRFEAEQVLIAAATTSITGCAGPTAGGIR
jgi:ferrous iron transport protein A